MTEDYKFHTDVETEVRRLAREDARRVLDKLNQKPSEGKGKEDAEGIKGSQGFLSSEERRRFAR